MNSLSSNEGFSSHTTYFHLIKLFKDSKSVPKEIGHKEPYYDTKISIFSFTWAGLAAFHKASTI